LISFNTGRSDLIPRRVREKIFPEDHAKQSIGITGFTLRIIEFLLKFGKSSYRRIPDRSPGQAPASGLFKTFWTPAFAGATT
jgi:hypothetical protein